MPYTIKFDSGKSVQFDEMPTQADIDEADHQVHATAPVAPNASWPQGPDQSAAETARLNRSGIQPTTPLGRVGDTLKQTLDPRAWEGTLSGVTGMAGSIGGALVGAGDFVANHDIDKANETMGKVADAMTYKPRTDVGKQSAEDLSKAFDTIGKGSKSYGTSLLGLMVGGDERVDPIAADVAGGIIQNALPIPELKGALGKALRPRVKGAELPPPRVDPTIPPEAPSGAPMGPFEPGSPEFYQAMAEKQAQAAREAPIYVNKDGVAGPEVTPRPQPTIPPAPENLFPELPRQADPVVPRPPDPTRPPLPETPVNPLLQLADKEIPPSDGGLRYQDPSLPNPRGDAGPQMDGFQNRPATMQGMDASVPTIDFPDRMSAFDKDPWLQQAAARVQEIQGQVTPEAKAEVKALTEHAVDLAKNSYGIDANTARKSLYSSGGDTAMPIKRGGRSLGGNRQSGMVDPDAFNLMDAFRNRLAEKRGSKIAANRQTEINQQLREKYRPLLDDAADFKQYQRVVNELYNKGIDPEFNSRLLKAMNPWNNEAIGARRMERVYEQFGDKQTVIDRIKKNANEAKLGGNNIRSLGGNKQSGMMDLSAFVPKSLMDRFKKKEPVSDGVTPRVRAVQDVLPEQYKAGAQERTKPLADPEEVMRNASAGEKDISKLSTKLTSVSGLNNRAMTTGNSVLRFADTKLFREGIEPAKGLIAKYLTDKDTGVATLLNKLRGEDRKEAWKAAFMEDKYNRRYSDAELTEHGFSDKTIALIKSMRENNTNIFSLNGRGDFRPGYLNHSFPGDYQAVAMDPQGNVRGVLNAKNAYELKKAHDWVKENHPEYTVTEPVRRTLKTESYNKGAFNVNDLMDLIKKNGKLDPEGLQNMINDRDITSTRNMFNADVHDLNRSKHEVWGWDGNKPWLDETANMSEGWKSYIQTSEQQYYHHMMQKPVNEANALFARLDESNAAGTTNQVNSVTQARELIADKTGKSDIWPSGEIVNKAADSILKMVGLSGRAAPRFVNAAHTTTRLIQLGANVGNMAAQLMQPILQGMPTRYMAQKAYKLNPFETHNATALGVTRWIADKAGLKTSPFEQRMWKFADDNGIRQFGATERANDAVSNRFVSGADKVGSAMSGVAENVTRPPMFAVFASMMEAAEKKNPGTFKNETEMLQTAHKLTDSVMVNYGQNPAFYRKALGVAGPLVGQFKTYGFASTQNLHMLVRNDPAAFIAAIAATSYVTGLSGLPFYQDLDNMVKNASPKISGKIMDLRDYTNKLFPKLQSMTGITENDLFTGKASNDLGVNIAPKFSFSNTIPAVDANSDVPGWMQFMGNAMPSVSAIGKPLASTVKAASSGFQNTGDNRQAIKDILPSGVARENYNERVLTNPDGLVLNPSTGQYAAHQRTPEERTMAKFGVTSPQEARDKLTKFKGDQQVHYMTQQRAQLETGLIQKFGNDDLTPQDIQEAADKYMAQGGDPKQFVNTFITKAIAAKQEGVARSQGVPSKSLSSIARYMQYQQGQK